MEEKLDPPSPGSLGDCSLPLKKKKKFPVRRGIRLPIRMNGVHGKGRLPGRVLRGRKENQVDYIREGDLRRGPTLPPGGKGPIVPTFHELNRRGKTASRPFRGDDYSQPWARVQRQRR